MGVDFVTRSVALDGPDKLGGMQAHLDIRDTGIANILDILKEALEQSEQGASLALACALLAGRLCETFGGKLSRPAISGGLGISRQRRVLSFIEAHLHEDLTLERLATEVDLSPNQFGRAFRTSLGASPLRYVAQRRIHRAKAMLLDPGRSITDIAMAL